MQVLKSNIRTDSEEFKQNEKNMLALMAQYREAMSASMQGGGESAVAKHKKRNKLLARERIDLLIDPNTGAPTCFEVKGAFEYPSENRTRFAFLTCRARFPFVRFRWFRLAKHGTWREEHPEGGRA